MAAYMVRKCVWTVCRFSRKLSVNYEKFISTTSMNQIRNRSRRTQQSYLTELSSDDTVQKRRRNVNMDDFEVPSRHVDDGSFHDYQEENYEKNESFYIPPHIKYETLRQSDSKFAQTVMLGQNKKMREKKRLFFLEGSRYILEAVNAGVKVVSMFFTKGEQLEHFPLDQMVADGTQLYKVKMGHMQLWSTLVAASGMMAICRMPKPGEPLVPMENPLPMTLVCDNIRDPGNLGILLRSAAAVGCQHVILTKGCVDPWDPKVLRAACSAHYHLGILTHISWDLLANYWPPDSQIYLIDGCPHSEEEQEGCGKKLRKKILNYDNSEFEEVVDTPGGRIRVDSSFKDKELLEAFAEVPLPVTDYFSPNYTESHAVVIACSDTYGISAEARKLVYEKHGDLLSVPLTTCVASLNTAVGSSLVLFEIMKQHLQHR